MVCLFFLPPVHPSGAVFAEVLFRQRLQHGGTGGDQFGAVDGLAQQQVAAGVEADGDERLDGVAVAGVGGQPRGGGEAHVGAASTSAAMRG